MEAASGWHWSAGVMAGVIEVNVSSNAATSSSDRINGRAGAAICNLDNFSQLMDWKNGWLLSSSIDHDPILSAGPKRNNFFKRTVIIN